MRPDPRTLGADCDNCPLNKRTPVVPRSVAHPKRRSLVVLAETPAENETKQNQFLVGPTGDLVWRRILGHIGVKRSEVHVSNALLCWPQEKLQPKDWTKAVNCCRPRLSNELQAVAPTTILAYGAKALKAVTGKSAISQLLGAPIPGADFFVGGRKKGTKVADFTQSTVVPTYHPAMLFRDQWQYLPVIRIHSLRAYEMSRNNDTPWSWGPLYLEGGKDMLCALKAILKHPEDPIAVDLEWVGKAPAVDIITCIGFANSALSVSVPWDDYKNLQGVSNPHNQIERDIKRATLQILSAPHLKIFQNGISDRMVMRHNGIAHKGPYFDTLSAHMIISPGTEHKLDFQACVEFNAPRWKQTFRGGKDTQGFGK